MHQFSRQKKRGLSLTASQSVGQEMSQRPPHLPIKADFINFLLQQVWEVPELPTSRAKLLQKNRYPDTQDRILNANEQEDSSVKIIGSLEDDLGVFLGELAWEGCSVQVVALCVLVQWLGCREEVHYFVTL